MALKCINSRHPGHYPNQNIQQCRGVLIADMLQRQSKFFPKINEISYRKVPFSTVYTYVINMECLGKQRNLFEFFKFILNFIFRLDFG